jgi:hypothetical protein
MQKPLFGAACVAVMALSAGALAQRAVPVEYQGRWVSGKAMCDSPVAMLVAADRVTFINGKDAQALSDVEMAGPGFFPPDYRGIMAVLITEFSGQQPASVTFNYGEKKGVGFAEFAPVMPGARNAASSAYNAHIQKLNLAKRFPLDKMPLKKC